MIRIIMADDHQVVRRGLKSIFDEHADMNVIYETSDGYEAIQKVKELKPTVLIVDIMMPGLNGLEVTRQVQKASPYTKVIILSMYANAAYIVEALKNGASGYVLKESSTSDLINAVRQVMAGHRFLSPSISEEDIHRYQEIIKSEEDDLYNSLTTREREIFQLTAEGYSSKEIGEKLSISHRTVETHRKNIFRKLNLSNQTDVIRLAIQKGIISLNG